MIYVLIATTPVMPGATERAVISFPGDKAQAIAFINSENIATPGVKYKVIGPVPENFKAITLCLQTSIASLTSTQAVQAGLNTPHNTGHGKVQGPVDSAGFQVLADMDLPPEDAIYGDAVKGEFSDLIQDGGMLSERK